MQLQRVWTDAEAEIRFWQLMRLIEETRRGGDGLWSRLLLKPQRTRRRLDAMGREAETLVARFTLPPAPMAVASAGTEAAGSRDGDEGERLARIHSAIRVAATLANDGAARPVREHARS